MDPRVGVTYSIRRKVGPYADAVRLAGLEPVLIAPDEPVSLASLDGLMLTGGCDIDPARYGETAHAATSEPDPARDALEASLIEQALAADLPILAICRGLQMLNVARGGTLQQDIPGHKVKDRDEVHTVSIRSGSRLETILGGAELWVNSRHHQAAGRLGAGLLVSASA
ncbi:MAG TPA: gamma-glutamyl-gamma-aminobutyrate hydrolase family protein, partial [Bryobacteraceae bacterium]